MVAASEREMLRRALEHRAELSGPKARRREIRNALARLKAGTYGFCEGCCLTIPWRELISRPERRRCERCDPALEGAVG